MVENSPAMIKAKITTLHRFPFFGNLLIGLVFIPNFNISTLRTNGEELQYNPDFFNSLSKEERIFCLLHEVLHIVCLHSVRMPKFADLKLWNIACDHVVNLLLNDMNGISMPSMAICDSLHRNKTAEQVYKELAVELNWPMTPTKSGQGNSDQESSNPGESAQDPSDQGSSDQDTLNPEASSPETSTQEESAQDNPNQEGPDSGGSGQEDSNQNESGQGSSSPSKGSDKINDLIERSERYGLVFPSEDKRSDTIEKKILVEACLQNRLLKKNQQYSKKLLESIPFKIKQDLEKVSDLKLPWHRLLADFFTKNAMNDYDWSIPDLEFQEEGIILPSLISDSANEFAIAIDTSGSINVPLLNRFIHETIKILTDIQYSNVHIIYCSDRIVGYDIFSKEKQLKIKSTEMGGTSYLPVWDLIARKNLFLSGLVYFTDLECFPEDIGDDPGFPVLWCAFGEYIGVFGKPYFGQIIEIKER